MIYDILEAKLVATGKFQPGVSLFRETMPSECRVGAYFRLPLSGIAVQPSAKNYFSGRIQLIVRHSSIVLGTNLTNDAVEALKVEALEVHSASAERGVAHLTHFYPETLPVRFPTLDGNATEWSVHFRAAFGFLPL